MYEIAGSDVMISSQTLQNVLDGLKGLVGRDFSILGRDGKVVASTQSKLLHTRIFAVEEFVQSVAVTQTVKGQQYFKVFDNGVAEYVVSVRGEDEDAYGIGKLVAFQIEGLIAAYKERFSRGNFIKNLLLDNLLLVDVYARAKKLSIELSMRRVVYLIEVGGGDENEMAAKIKENFVAKGKDFVAILDRTHIILVKELRKWEEITEIENYANILATELAKDLENPLRIGIGTVVYELPFVSRSYKEAKMALEAGEIFESDQNVLNYETLGLLRLIYQLPRSLCKMFVTEIFGDVTADDFDEEDLAAVDKFFENNLNVSETARQLFIHRNTLAYRLDKLQKMTGLDLRSFDDAIIFKTTLLVSKYLKHKEAHKMA